MSFVKKAVKKVFKVVKKVVKSKIFKIVAIAAIIFFTAGVAAGGFAAFAGVNSLGTFFVAVGQTMATGAAAMASGVGLSGVSSSLAAHGGAAATAAGLAGAPGALGAVTIATEGLAAGALASPAAGSITASSLGEAALAGAGAVAPVASAAPVVAANAVIPTVAAGSGRGVGSAISNLMGKKVLGDVSLGQVVTNGIVGGIQQVIKGKQKGQEFANGYVAGGLARGGPKEAPDPYSFEFGGAGSGDPGKQEDELSAPGQTLAGQLAQEQGGPSQGGLVSQNGIQGRLAERGNISDPNQFGPEQRTGAPPPPAPPTGLLAPQQQRPGDLAGSPFTDRPRDIRGLV